MRTYQTVVIVKPDIDESQIENAGKKIDQFITKYSGSVLKLEVWGKKRLAYRIRKNRYGFYLNFCHTLEPANVSNFEKDLKLDEEILKYLVIRLEPAEVERLCAQTESPQEEEPSEKNDNKASLAEESK